MLLPLEFAILSVQEARQLVEYIEKSTASKTMPIRYDKIQQVGMLDIYMRLREFVELHKQYQALQTLDIDRLAYLTD